MPACLLPTATCPCLWGWQTRPLPCGALGPSCVQSCAVASLGQESRGAHAPGKPRVILGAFEYVEEVWGVASLWQQHTFKTQTSKSSLAQLSPWILGFLGGAPGSIFEKLWAITNQFAWGFLAINKTFLYNRELYCPNYLLRTPFWEMPSEFMMYVF